MVKEKWNVFTFTLTAAFRSNFLRSITRERNRLWGVLHLPSQGPLGCCSPCSPRPLQRWRTDQSIDGKKRKGDRVLRESQTQRQELGKVVGRVTVNIKWPFSCMQCNAIRNEMIRMLQRKRITEISQTLQSNICCPLPGNIRYIQTSRCDVNKRYS